MPTIIDKRSNHETLKRILEDHECVTKDGRMWHCGFRTSVVSIIPRQELRTSWWWLDMILETPPRVCGRVLCEIRDTQVVPTEVLVYMSGYTTLCTKIATACEEAFDTKIKVILCPDEERRAMPFAN